MGALLETYAIVDRATVTAQRTEDFEFVEPLGSGFHAEIWLARYRSTGELCALKRLGPGSFEGAHEQLQAEAAALLGLAHPNIVALLDEGPGWLALEYLPGASVADALETGPLPLDQALQIARDVATAVEYLHAEGWLHLDIVPANVLLASDGTAKLADFGCAVRAEEAHSQPYDPFLREIAPEVVAGGSSTKAADVYAVGRLLFHMLAGDPYSGTFLDEQALPERLHQLVSTTLSINPSERPTAAELLQALDEVEAALPPPPGAPAAPR